MVVPVHIAHVPNIWTRHSATFSFIYPALYVNFYLHIILFQMSCGTIFSLFFSHNNQFHHLCHAQHDKILSKIINLFQNTAKIKRFSINYFFYVQFKCNYNVSFSNLPHYFVLYTEMFQMERFWTCILNYQYILD